MVAIRGKLGILTAVVALLCVTEAGCSDVPVAPRRGDNLFFHFFLAVSNNGCVCVNFLNFAEVRTPLYTLRPDPINRHTSFMFDNHARRGGSIQGGVLALHVLLGWAASCGSFGWSGSYLESAHLRGAKQNRPSGPLS